MPRLWTFVTNCAFALCLFIGAANATDIHKISGFNIEHSGEQIRIFLSDGSSIDPDKETDQKKIVRPAIAKGGKFIGWIVEHSDCCVTHPSALTLVFYRNDGHLISVKFKQTILSWTFDVSGEKAIIKTGSAEDVASAEYALYDLTIEEIVGSSALDDSNKELPLLAPPKCTDMCSDIEYQELMGTL